MKQELSACILIPNLAVLCPAKVGIKMHALSSCFISTACFSAFYCSPFTFFLHLCTFSIMQLYSFARTIQNMLFLFALEG